MNIESIVLRNLKRLKTKNKSDWNHVKYHHDSYLCPNNFYNKECIPLFRYEFLNKNQKNNIYKRTTKIEKNTSRYNNDNS
tara:strand:+ start:676 stop:915 length:240 start_codon:yes stop_codon:yes gene_type:complete